MAKQTIKTTYFSSLNKKSHRQSPLQQERAWKLLSLLNSAERRELVKRFNQA
jgi:hypothetical protein